MSTESPIEYGHHAQNDRWIAELVFPGLRGGFFVEAGICGGQKGSASYVLERELGWDGIGVEPGDEYYRVLVAKRSCKADHRCLSDTTGDTVEFLTYPDDLARSGMQALNKNVETWGVGHEGSSSTKETVTLNDLLEQHDAPPVVNFLCLDVEGAEPTILGAFDFDGKRRILALSVEGGHCDELLRSKGYLRVTNPFSPDPWDHYFVDASISDRFREYAVE